MTDDIFIIPLQASDENTNKSSGIGLSTATISICGSVNPNPYIGWASGDVRLSITYTIETMIEQDKEKNNE
jgi:hypothetical protein